MEAELKKSHKELNQKSGGFTLTELLVAMLLVALVLTPC